MGLVDAFSAEKRFDITYSELYALTRAGAKIEFIMNGIRNEIPHDIILQFVDGKKGDDKE